MNENMKSINRRKKLDHAHSTELLRCKIFFNDFLKKFPPSINVDFKKIFEMVKVPFTSLPSMLQIKPLFQIYLSRYLSYFFFLFVIETDISCFNNITFNNTIFL